MKQCPVCKSRCFDDMDVCYGCMHRFGEEVPGRPDSPACDDVPFEVEEPAEPLPEWRGRDCEAPAARRDSPATFVFPMEGGGYDLAISIRPAAVRRTDAGCEPATIPTGGEGSRHGAGAPRGAESPANPQIKCSAPEDIDMAELESMVEGDALFCQVEAMAGEITR